MLKLVHVSKHYQDSWPQRRTVRAVNDLSLEIPAGICTGLLGPSGCGKSTLARLAARLIEPTSGQIFYQDAEITRLTPYQFRPFRRKIQIIFQQPLLALDPRQTIGDALLEPLFLHRLIQSRRQGEEKIRELLELTHLPAEVLPRLPGQLSGGQAQRVAIARSLSLDPAMIVADEPTAMLDLSVQAQILALLKSLQLKKNVGILLISHDPDVIRACAEQAVIMAEGEIAAAGKTEDLLPATAGLFVLRDKIHGKTGDASC